MGVVKRDIYKNEIQFRYIPFSDPNAINALIRFRSELDLYFTYESEHVENLIKICVLKAEEVLNKKMNKNIEIKINNERENKFSASDINDVNQELICLYISLDELIKEVSLSEQQEIIMNLFMAGFKANEIGLYLNKTTQQINNILQSICKKIANESKKQWKYKMANLDYIRVQWDYKKCSKCERCLPLTNDFFAYDKTNKRFKSVCLKCHNK